MKLFMKRHQETIGHEESKIPLFFFEFEFWAFFGGTMGVATTWVPEGLGSRNLTKNGPSLVEVMNHCYFGILIRNFPAKFKLLLDLVST